MTTAKPKGFWSYARHDGDHSDGRMDALHRLLCHELGSLLGLAGPVDIFLDKSSISTGDEWEKMIEGRLAEADFLIAMLSPNFLSRPWCCKEVLLFQQREKVIGRSDLIFPVEYFDITDLRGPLKAQVADPAALALLEQRQINGKFKPLRWDDPSTSVAVRHFVGALATEIKNKLIRQPVPGDAAPIPVKPVPVVPRPAIIVPDAVMQEPPGPEMVLIPAGAFLMGIPEAESKREAAFRSIEIITRGRGAFALGALRRDIDGDARPVRKVTVPHPFWMGKYPVLRREYAVFANETGRGGDPWASPRFKQDDRHPVVNVSHDDATAYLKWLSDKTGQAYRLPSEAEWEYAARAGTKTARYWGDDAGQPGEHAHFGSRDGTRAAGGFPANPFGLHDMVGNVWEWTADSWHDSYKGAPASSDAWIAGGAADRVVRGGSWGGDARFVRAACRVQGDPVGRGDGLGFRCVRVQAT